MVGSTVNNSASGAAAHVLTFEWTVCWSPEVRRLARDLAVCPPPAAFGLHSRYWRMERGAIYARYLFRSRGDLQGFARDPSLDSAFALMSSYAPESAARPPRVEEFALSEVIDRPVFIISAPRAGSTLLYELMSRSGNVWTISGESEGVIEGVPRLHIANRGFDSHRLTDLDADGETTQALRAGFIAESRDNRGRRLLDLPQEERPPKIRLLEKTPENSMRVPFLAAAFPTGRFVFLHRDARQSVSSILEAWRHDGFINIPSLPGWPPGRWCFLLPEGWRALAGAASLDVAVFQWASANQRALDDLETVAEDRWISVDYEELVTAPDAVVRRVCDFAEIVVDESLAKALARPLPVSSTAITPPSPIKWRGNPEFRESALTRCAPISARLRNLGRSAAPPPRGLKTPIRYSCFLDEILYSGAISGEDLIVNPSFHFQLGPTVPLALLRHTRFRDRFLPDCPILWVKDMATGVIYPFWARRSQARLFGQFVAGQAPPQLDEELRLRLVSASALVRSDDLTRRLHEGREMAERAGAQFAARGYCELPSALHPAHAASLGRYYGALINCGQWSLGDEQVRFRHGWHNEPVCRYFHYQLTGLVSRVANEPVKPSYAYTSAYQEGARLKPHVDRKQCVFTLSLFVEHSDTPSAERWPLWFHAHDGKVAVTQASGDAVLFRGCDLPHWRDRPPKGAASTTLLFHYVPADFAGVLD
ncbi:MAG TPA: sulfotransferase [Blastocatellia bacterium]|nr:sulfotransferase [Blastocatellia bacterium]